MKVIYYTFTPFLDCALELINVLKKHVELHVIIEISPENLRSNILDIPVLPNKGELLKPEVLLSKQQQQVILPYLDGAASVHFMAYTHKRSFSYATFEESMELVRFVQKMQPEVVHFEGFSVRSMGLIPFIRKKRVFYTLHDPLPHSGENNWRLTLAKRLYFKIAKGYFFYSAFSRQLFAGYYKQQQKKENYLLKLYPYSIFNFYKKSPTSEAKHILFFGRISPYKGIETLLKAAPHFFKVHPDERLVIAGKTIAGYSIENLIPDAYATNIKMIEKHLSNEELVKLIQQAKIVVCPYRDATQSGVLMTAHALQVPVIATDTGAFTEYIEHNVNGLLFPVDDHMALTACLLQAFEGDHLDEYREEINHKYKVESWEDNAQILLDAYHQDRVIAIRSETQPLESQKVS